MILCPQCNGPLNRRQAYINRAARQGVPIYCGKRCSSDARKLKNPPTETEKKAAKAAYDREYREKNLTALKAKRKAWFRKDYDENPEKYREIRQKKMASHVEYCRRPEYKQYKSAYDRQHRAKEYGPFADSHVLLLELEKEIGERMSKYEIALTNGTINKAQKRRRAMQCPQPKR